MNFRKNLRLKDYDYTSNGYCFVTICTKNHQTLFVAAPSYGANKSPRDIVEEKLRQINKYYPGVYVDYSMIMPDHIHVIFILEDENVPLSRVINAFKSWVTRDIKKNLASQGDAATMRLIEGIWQPNYYEHIIRNEKALTKIRDYIENNPDSEKLNWSELDN